VKYSAQLLQCSTHRKCVIRADVAAVDTSDIYRHESVTAVQSITDLDCLVSILPSPIIYV